VKQIVVISGKGGTGKTVITGAFAALAENKVMADCDVDAPDLHLLLNPEVKKETVFFGMPKAVHLEERCRKCGSCDKCRFGALKIEKDNVSFKVNINSSVCEGCALCEFLCNFGAIEMREIRSGDWFISETAYGSMVHALLQPGEENSGMLVALCRKEAGRIAEENGNDYVIIDGPPGSGCPVISAVTGSDAVVFVTEPTGSGLSDLKKVLDAVKQFDFRKFLCINKYDINPGKGEEIREFAGRRDVEYLGRIPFDREVQRSVEKRVPFIEYSDNSTARSIKDIFGKLKKSVDS